MGQEDAPDCTEHCKSTQHGDIITAAITRRSVSDLDLCSFINSVCCRCESVKDSEGRTALHMAASCGRIELIRWLVNKRLANINEKDEESGCSALHRSIFYGKINVAVELIKSGANISLIDCDSLTPLEHAMKDRDYYSPYTHHKELYVWGSNSNNYFGSHTSRAVPELMDIFHKNYPNEFPCDVAIGKFHCLIRTSDGKVFSCGHGQGGRLGLKVQKTVVVPELVQFPAVASRALDSMTCTQFAVSVDHSMFVCADGNVYTCGLNKYKVLGLKSIPDQELTPTQVRKFPEEVNGIRAGQYHSIAWGFNAVYAWGLNLGQLGAPSGLSPYIILPKPISMLNIGDSKICRVDSSDAAIAVYTSRGDVYVLHEYQCRKIVSRQTDLVKICVIGGKLDANLCKDLSIPSSTSRELKVAALTLTGNLMVWQESDPQLCRCIFNISRALEIRELTLNYEGVLFVTVEGEAFRGTFKPRRKQVPPVSAEKSAFHKFLDRNDCVSVKITKIPRLHRAEQIKSDLKGNDFCVIQEQLFKEFTVPKVSPSIYMNDFEALLNSCHENDDLHDVIFKVDNSNHIAAHKFVLASKCENLKKRFQNVAENFIEIDNCNPLIFRQFLLYVYTNDCDLLKYGESWKHFQDVSKEINKETCKEGTHDIGLKPEEHNNKSAFEVYNNKDKNKSVSKKSKHPLRMLHKLAKTMGCTSLCDRLDKPTNTKKGLTTTSFQRDIFDLCDVTIKCSDGREIKAHKCILAARAEYFNNLFSMRWNQANSEECSITLPCTKNVVESLLNYLYTDNSNLDDKEPDFLLKTIIIADHLFIERLKEQCESLLFKHMGLKNAVQYLKFAYIYNADNLKECCLKFICCNIEPFLEQRLFDDLDDDVMRDISSFYCSYNSKMSCREITPFSIAASEEEIVSVSTAFPVSFSDEPKIVTPLKATQKRRHRPHRHNSLNKSFSDKNQLTNDDSPSSLEKENVINKQNVTVELASDGTNVLNRLTAIKLAAEKLEDDCLEADVFTILKSRQDCEYSSTFEEFPLLNSPPSNSFVKPTLHKSESKHVKIVKMSQRQRKRLSQSDTCTDGISESPKNPWKMPEISSPSLPLPDLSGIISLERKQKDNLVKMTSRSLALTQIEDRAIEELAKFYNVNDVSDELIFVQRVDIGNIAKPVWVPSKKA